MKERPTIFSGDMVKAILEGRKTQTRRVITADNSTVCGYGVTAKSKLWTGLVWDERVYVDHGPHILHPSRSQYLHVPWVNPEDPDDHRVFRVRCKYDIGDRLWVRETIYYNATDRYYAADVGGKAPANCDGVISSRFMPQWASRILLEITDVRVERLQEISEEDVVPEGFPWRGTGAALQFGYRDPLIWYRELWDSLNAKRGYGWDTNPWVWVITFAPLHEEG